MAVEIGPRQSTAPIREPPGFDLLDRDTQDESLTPGYQFADLPLHASGAPVEKDHVK